LSQARPLSKWAHGYIVSVVLLGLGVTAQSVYSIYVHPPRRQWLVLATLTLLTGSFTVKIPSVKARISVSEAFVFVSVLLFGPATATVTVALDSFVISLWMKHDARSSLRALFNLSAVALAIWVASHAFFELLGAPSAAGIGLERLALPLIALATLYFILNSSLVALALAAEQRVNPIRLWKVTFPWLSLNYFGGASVAALLVSYTAAVDLSAVGIIIPLLVISYLTYRTSLGRVEDAERHVDQVNSLYMSTIETLAMAVDAKDQITHGHIRRVQVYATELARRLGLTDERQIQAIQAAALLHDLGKLAIPEHILNKPGKLSDAEFERMKRHAAIGAELLSSITFPYPVVPIVRYHHENWNGTGYPSGIGGTDIPLGARILSVVDCFDALTSDRPYRPRLTTDAAFRILAERRGTMYDPMVVDAFVAAYEEIAPMAKAAGQHARTIIPGEYFEWNPPFDGQDARPVQPGDESLIASISETIAATQSIQTAVERAATLLGDALPVTTLALFIPDSSAQSLMCIQAAGAAANALHNLRIPYGERISGWVMANSTSVYNSDPFLDLGHIAKATVPPLLSTLAVPVITKQLTTAVVTVYSSIEEAYTDRHGIIVERIAPTLGEHVRTLLAIQRGSVVTFRESVDKRIRP
jgi:putative nucleotidyltransferase with HDIG domain